MPLSLTFYSSRCIILTLKELMLEYNPPFLDPSPMQDTFPWDSSLRFPFSSPEIHAEILLAVISSLPDTELHKLMVTAAKAAPNFHTSKALSLC